MSDRHRITPARAPRRRLAGAALALSLLLAPGAAGAADLAAVAADLEGLRGELAALRAVQPAQAGDEGRLARFAVRLGQLEEQLRRLTGRVEELEFQERRTQQRLDQLVGDLDARLAELERGAAATGAGAAALPAPVEERQGGAQQGAQQGAPGPASRPAAAVTERRPAAEGSGGTPPVLDPEEPLGTIPEGAVLGARRPAPETAATTPPADLPPQQQYDTAMDRLRAGDYAGAEQGLQRFLDENPDHPLAANAAYWLAETHYVRKNYAAAAAAFARNYREYGKDAVKAPDNLLKLGMSLHGLGETDKACLSYDELANAFPNAPAHIQQALARERERAQCA